MSPDALNWRVEQACLNAWPSPAEVLLDGWLLRSAGGPTRRANSANMLHPDAVIDDALIDRVEAFYRAQGRPAMVRVTDMARSIDPLLEARGYTLDAPTRTLYSEMAELVLGDTVGVLVSARPEPDWLAARDAMISNDAAGRAAYRAVIGSILLPCGYAAVSHEERIAAIAFGVVQDDLLIIESVVTDPALRRMGFARRMLSGLLIWAKEQGAQRAALQPMADNVPALAFYRGMGFEHDLYGYHYRVKA